MRNTEGHGERRPHKDTNSNTHPCLSAFHPWLSVFIFELGLAGNMVGTMVGPVIEELAKGMATGKPSRSLIGSLTRFDSKKLG